MRPSLPVRLDTGGKVKTTLMTVNNHDEQARIYRSQPRWSAGKKADAVLRLLLGSPRRGCRESSGSRRTGCRPFIVDEEDRPVDLSLSDPNSSSQQNAVRPGHLPEHMDTTILLRHLHGTGYCRALVGRGARHRGRSDVVHPRRQGRLRRSHQPGHGGRAGQPAAAPLGGRPGAISMRRSTCWPRWRGPGYAQPPGRPSHPGL
jgi:hypothetical protein